MSVKSLRVVAICATVLALFVVMLGAYTRLTDAGLGCPDWPGCYGRMVLPSAPNEITHAQSQYPFSPIESRKAWTEMAHRYVAGTLALFILFIGLTVLWRRRQGARYPSVLPLTLLVLVGFQAALGMWTVTLKLLPVVVMGHLLGGILIFASLVYLCWQLRVKTGPHAMLPIHQNRWLRLINLGIVIVFLQIALGGWVSSNYAGIACVGFPRCNGQWFPALHVAHSFNLFSAVGANYQGGMLDNDARMTIQFVHRLGAWVTAIYVLLLSGFLPLRGKPRALRCVVLIAILLVLTQFMLGVINVTYLLPLWAAVAHNGVAALLLAAMVSMRYLFKEGAVHARQS